MGSKVAILLLNWNGWKDTIACLESIMRLENANLGVFVCDNASSDNSIAELRAWASTKLPVLAADRDVPLTFKFMEYKANADHGFGEDWPPKQGSAHAISLIHTGGNLGFAGGNNVGLRYAMADGYDYFCLLNNDTEIRPDTLMHLLDRMEKDPEIGICGSTLVYAANPTLVQNLGGASFNRLKGRGAALGGGSHLDDPVDPAEIEKKMHFVSGASMLVSRRFVQEIGLMAEDYFLYFEEPDWAERARGKFKLGYAPRSIVFHKVGASIGTDDFGNSSPLSLYYMARNRVRFCWRFHKEALPFVAADIGRQIFKLLRRRQWSRALLVFRAALNLPYQA